MTYHEKLQAIEALARDILVSAQITADDGTTLYCPDGNIYYRGIWSRDFCYAVEDTGNLVPDEHVKQGFEYLIHHQRADGGMPSCVRPDGSAGYVTIGGENHTDGDNSQFMVKLADAYRRRTGSNILFERHLDALVRGLDVVPRNERGLVWIDPEDPHTGYGFRDCVGVKGADMFCSLLYWESAGIIARAAKELGNDNIAERFFTQVARIEENLHELFDEQTGAFIAGTVAERHVDIWANAYFIHLQVPLPELRTRVLDFLVTNHERFLQDGQVRHLLKGESWDHVNCYVMPEGTYQNGAYWGVASGWMLSAFLDADPELARITGVAFVDDLLNRGVYECVNRGFLWGGHGVEYTKVPHYVATITNPLSSLWRIHRQKEDV